MEDIKKRALYMTPEQVEAFKRLDASREEQNAKERLLEQRAEEEPRNRQQRRQQARLDRCKRRHAHAM